MLFALPPDVSLDSFRSAMGAALSSERFAFPKGVDDPHSCKIEPADDLRKSVFYNMNPRKSRYGAPDVYVCPSSPKQSAVTPGAHECRTIPKPRVLTETLLVRVPLEE